MHFVSAGGRAALASLAERTQAPLVSEHIAFVRAKGREAGHLLPVPRTREAVSVIVHNVRAAMAELPVPLALEPIASLVEWPHAELDEGAFITEILERTDALLLLDLANLYANTSNHGGDPAALLDRLPLERIAYVHVAGGLEREGLYHDTHAHPVPKPVLELLVELARRRPIPAVMLERDHRHPPAVELDAELDALGLAAGFTGAAGRAVLVRLDEPMRSGLAGSRSTPGHRPPSVAAAARLGDSQAMLLGVLLDGDPPLPGFDPVHLEAAASALARKRADHHARGRCGPAPTAARPGCGRLRRALRMFRSSIRPASPAAGPMKLQGA